MRSRASSEEDAVTPERRPPSPIKTSEKAHAETRAERGEMTRPDPPTELMEESSELHPKRETPRLTPRARKEKLQNPLIHEGAAPGNYDSNVRADGRATLSQPARRIRRRRLRRR